MKKILLFSALCFSAVSAKTQFYQDDLIYYVGSGPDTAVLVIDFLDGTEDSSYAWGYLFDASATVTAADMLADIDASEPTLSIAMGGFLNDITYNAHAGIGGSPNFWGTWSATESTAWISNAGISEVLANGSWFGCSYTDFSPAIEPGEPIAAYQSTKFSADNVLFWTGTGTDSAVLVIDFVTDVYAEAVSYAWGYLFNGPTDGETMLNAIDAADVNLDIDMSGGFLNDILFNGMAGLVGSPDYWATWSGTNLSDWTMNFGISTAVNDGDWFGCSYEPWPPRRPFNPIPALDSAAFIMSDVTYWVGNGSDSAIVVIDFNETAPGESFAFGYAFSGTTTAAQALQDLADVNPDLSVNMGGGFLNDILYGSYSGIGGSPYYWGTWSATNVGGWEMNAGITEVLSDGDWFGCSYTAWSPATPPGMPVSALDVTGLAEHIDPVLDVYPNPTNGMLYVTLEKESRILVTAINGKNVLDFYSGDAIVKLDLSGFETGVYFVVAISEGIVSSQKIIKN